MKFKFLVLIFLSMAMAIPARADSECVPKLISLFGMRSHYIGEHDGSLNRRGKTIRVKYLDAFERPNYALSFVNGSFAIGGRKISCGFLACSKIFVADREGNILVGNDIVDRFHHSSFLAGGEIAAGGRITFRNGKIISFDNFSGHYHPNGRSNIAMLIALLQKGFPLPENIGFVMSFPSDVGGEVIINVNLQNLINKLNRGESGYVRGLPEDNLAALKFVLRKYGFVK